MILAYHIIFGTYGFWLPNDPRGSWSTFVASWDLFQYGTATKVANRRSHAHDPHDRRFRMAAKSALLHEPVKLSGAQALSVGNGFARAVRASEYSILACSILPEHVHLVVARHRYDVEQVVRRLKQFAGKQLAEDGLHPFENELARRGALPAVFARGCWKCFIDNEKYVDSAIGYVQANPLKEGKKRQAWKFVATP